MACSLRYWNTMILFLGRYLIGVVSPIDKFRKFYYNQKKKVLVVCLAGCAVGSVFGSGDYNRKKSSSHLSGRLCCCVSFWFWQLRPEKKSSSRLSGGLWCNEFVLVLAKIDLIRFEHSICISSTWIKTNTNPSVQLQHIRYI